MAATGAPSISRYFGRKRFQRCSPSASRNIAMDTATILRSRPSASATDDRRVVTAGVAGVRSPPTRASGIEPPTRGRAARRLVASLARFTSRRIGTWRCMTSFRVLGCRPEYQHSRCEEREDEQDDAPTPHSDSDQSRVYEIGRASCREGGEYTV